MQAAIGALALDKAREVGGKLQEEILGKQILTLAALSILITAPLGAALIAIIGPMLLHQVRVPVGQSSNICEDSIMEDVEGWVGCIHAYNTIQLQCFYDHCYIPISVYYKNLMCFNR